MPQQRREIGIGMALGWSRRRLAVRPLLVGVQIALLGALFGVMTGLVVMAALRPVYRGLLPLPVWHMDFQPAVFARGAVLGFALPLVATAWPVWRAVRVMPVDAISTAHRGGRSGLAPLLRRFPWPVSAFRRMPLGNVLRTPRRTLMTVLALGAVMTAVVAVLGMIDSIDDARLAEVRYLNASPRGGTVVARLPVIRAAVGTLAAVAAGLIANGVFGWLLEAPTVAGREAMDHIEGLKMYLAVAEGEVSE